MRESSSDASPVLGGLDNPGFVVTDGAPNLPQRKFDTILEMDKKDEAGDDDDEGVDVDVEKDDDEDKEELESPTVQLEMKTVEDKEGVKIQVRVSRKSLQKQMYSTVQATTYCR